jgi:uncharacterized protein HemX
MSTKLVAILAAILIVAGGGFYVMSQKDGASQGVAVQEPASSNTASPNATGAAQASGSIDDFTSSIDADLKASAGAIGTLDAGIDTSVSNVQTTGASSNLYDPAGI